VVVLFRESAARLQAPFFTGILCPEEGHLIRSLAAINCRLVVIPVAITVVIFLNDYSVPIPMFVAVTDDCTVAISIAVTIMPSADCYACRSYTDSNLFRTCGHCNANARNGGNYQRAFHHFS
jgi:hypothetical protein